MYKASIEICRINRMVRLRFGLILKSKDNKNNITEAVSKFSYCGNDYLKVNPNPFFTIDITSYMMKNEGWNTNNTVSFNRYFTFQFLQKVRKLLNDFKINKNLYYYDNNHELQVDKKLAESLSIYCYTNSSKKILLMPCVVPDENNSELVFEGVILCINSMDNFAYIAYNELEYLYYEMGKINMVELAMSLINTSKLFEQEEIKKLESPVSTEKITSMNNEIESPSSITIINKTNNIPKI